ncbi:MAG: apolipoprotein acyltransferase [Micrococcales bacterium]|nr:MAG: apolipoprotein acyltransferase [Micrococcales bacterium]PIE26092.1 MAG: apolipoprotein acyltransferase [Micrococcales bacterium]
MRVAMIQLGYGDDEPVEARRQRAAGLVREQRGADLVVLPELWAPGGFSYRDWNDRTESVPGPSIDAIAAAAADIGAHVHAGCVVESTGEHWYNTAAFLGPGGQLLATYRKVHRFGFGDGEKALLAPGRDLRTIDARLGHHDVRIGLATCYDLRFPELFRGLLDRGATMLLVPATWPMARVSAWRLFAQARAAENQCHVVAVNTAGTHAGTQMGGHSMLVAPDGTVLAEAGVEEEVLAADIDPDEVSRLRAEFPVLADRQPATVFAAP